MSTTDLQEKKFSDINVFFSVRQIVKFIKTLSSDLFSYTEYTTSLRCSLAMCSKND